VRVSVELTDRTYDVVIGDGARHELAGLIATRVPDARMAAIIVPASLREQPWFDLSTNIDTVIIDVPDGESAKTLSHVESLCDSFVTHGLSRRDVVIGVGGGATTDLAGFAAAVYQRGIAVAHVATSLVAQVDAAIGGKTAVNLTAGKNLVGAFHQPVGVLCDLATLSTLPEREWRCGQGEVAKCWLLEGRTVNELREASTDEWITAAVALKSRIVGADEREGGQRALLNYGHTLAHSLEAQKLGGSSLDVLHGEAVAIGMAFAVRLAQRLGRVGPETVGAHDDVLSHWGLPSALPRGLRADDLLAAMAKDKKAHHNLTFVLPGPEGFDVVPDLAFDTVHAALLDFGAL